MVTPRWYPMIMFYQLGQAPETRFFELQGLDECTRANGLLGFLLRLQRSHTFVSSLYAEQRMSSTRAWSRPCPTLNSLLLPSSVFFVPSSQQPEEPPGGSAPGRAEIKAA